MAIRFTLEDFENPVSQQPTPSRPEDLAGYEIGYAAALAEMASRQSLLAQDTVQAISDITFGFAEARLHVMASLEPLFRVLVTRILPDSLPDSFRSHLVAHLSAAARQDTTRPFELALNPQQVAAVSNVLPPTLGSLLRLTADPGLSPHTAAIRQGDIETVLDHDALLQEICTALSALFDHITESKSHG